MSDPHERRPAFEPATRLLRPTGYDPTMPRPAAVMAAVLLLALRIFSGTAVLVAALILGKAVFGEQGLVFPLIVTAVGALVAVLGVAITRVRPGGAVTVTADGTSERFKGSIGFISPKAEFTPKSVETTELRTDLVYRVRIVLPGAAHALRQGMPVSVSIDEARR